MSLEQIIKSISTLNKGQVYQPNSRESKAT